MEVALAKPTTTVKSQVTVPVSPESSNRRWATLAAMHNGKAQRLNLEDIDLICDALECQPGDLLIKLNRRERRKRWLWRTHTFKKNPALVEHHRNGKRRYVSKAFATEKEAKEHLQNQQSAKNNGEFVEPSKVTLAVLFDEWLDTIRPRVAQRTADGYEGLFVRYVRPELESKRVNQLETRDIQRLYAAMQSQKSLSARIVRHTHAVLRQVLEQAVEWKLILRNLADLLKRRLPKVSEAERRVLDEIGSCRISQSLQ